MSELLTIKETSVLTGKSEGVIYRYIRRGKLKCQTVSEHGKEIKKIKKEEAIKVFNIKSQTVSDSVRTEKSDSSEPVQKVSEPKENFKEILEQFFQEKETQLMKPLESQALYRLGQVEKENEFLKAKVETLLQELEKFKALPVDLEIKDREIQGLNEEIKALAEKNREQEERLKRKWWKWWK